MSLRDRLSLIHNAAVDGDHLIGIKESMARAARLANENRRRLLLLNQVVDDLILPPGPVKPPPLPTLPPYPHYVVMQASAMVGPRRES